MALCLTKDTVATWEATVPCSIPNQYQKLQVLQARSFANRVSFIQVEKLLIYRGREYNLLTFIYSKSDQ